MIKLSATLALLLVMSITSPARAEDRVTNLADLDDGDMKSMATQFADAVVDSDPPGFFTMIAPTGVRWFGKKLTKDQAKKQIVNLGIAKFVRMEQPKEEA